MGRMRGGFTIIEVVLFVGISGFLIVGLMVGTSSTIARHRYDDSVQDMAEFFRSEYSAVVNPENIREIGSIIDRSECSIGGETSVSGTDDDSDGSHRGRSACLLYGRLITMGEDSNNSDSIIRSYDVIGRELSENEISEISGIEDALTKASLKLFTKDSASSSSACAYRIVGEHQYRPQWEAVAQTTSSGGTPLRASVLIVRSPVDGSIHTLFNNNVIKVQDAMTGSCTASSVNSLLNREVIAEFATRSRQSDLDICVGSDDIMALSGNRRRNIRISKKGYNSSAVAIIEQDGGADGGNACE